MASAPGEKGTAHLLGDGHPCTAGAEIAEQLAGQQAVIELVRPALGQDQSVTGRQARPGRGCRFRLGLGTRLRLMDGRG